MEILVHAHSGLRYVVLGLLLGAIAIAFSKKDAGTSKIYLFAMVSTHVQLLLGLALYTWSPKVNFSMMKDAFYRFYNVEHLTGMIIAIVLITIGYSKAKRMNTAKRHKTVLLFYSLGLLIILASIPWPFRANLGGSWF
ncbi:MAG: cytochrome B [Runella slithyformis]|jgi:hypothetical protein|nr:MAG: cytochrome B [Runella slithyformis]TAF95873.1 MAG: cytochrome B [Runella sp.]TAG20357.1 MAG: cytochrome B [Cytophagales bacterium]TAG39513.1 MAG: cytochrome B [Cytophagia bacterium]TAF24461.1 MAG: cytochrome B [Runella slithyformis]